MKIRSILQLLCVSLAVVAASCGRSGSLSVYNIADYGAEPSDSIDCSLSIQKAIDACADAGGGTVVIPAGKTFMSGPLHLRSNINLLLEPGSRLLANPDESVYTESAFGKNEG